MPGRIFWTKAATIVTSFFGENGIDINSIPSMEEARNKAKAIDSTAEALDYLREDSRMCASVWSVIENRDKRTI